MSKFPIAYSTCLFAALISSAPCHAVPSLSCIPKILIEQEPAENAAPNQNNTTARRIRVYYVNGHRHWEAKAQVSNGQVKVLIFGAHRNRPFTSSKIDNNGFGSGIDFRGMPWEFHGFLDP